MFYDKAYLIEEQTDIVTTNSTERSQWGNEVNNKDSLLEQEQSLRKARLVQNKNLFCLYFILC